MGLCDRALATPAVFVALPPHSVSPRIQEYNADALVHFGMHGTVEWLPGSPLGNTGGCMCQDYSMRGRGLSGLSGKCTHMAAVAAPKVNPWYSPRLLAELVRVRRHAVLPLMQGATNRVMQPTAAAPGIT